MITAFMICHTHWDREWYLTREQFKPKLVRLMDSVLELIENTDASFMLDGQMIVIEDYLQIKPENHSRLKKAMKSGKLFAGPWYVLPDEMLVSGESLIRNCLMGIQLGKVYGSYTKIGYLPDSFGHPEQMPQILLGLSLHTALFWRGTNNQIKSSEFFWESPCEGIKVFSVHLPFGYGNSANLSDNMDETIPRLNSMIERLASRSQGKIVLLMNGSDHIVAQTNIQKIVEKYNQQQGRAGTITISNIEKFIQELRPMLPDNLPTYTGELRSGDHSMLLGGTISTRMYLKQENALIQRTMERYLEPIASVSMLLRHVGDFGGYQHYLWKKILENHPHDSICGCSIDPVHEEMMTRMHCVVQLEQVLLSDGMKSFASPFEKNSSSKEVSILRWNPIQDHLSEYAELTIDFDPMLIQRTNFSNSTVDEYEDNIKHPKFPTALEAFDEDGNPIPAVLLSAQKDDLMHLQNHTAPEVYRVNRCRVALLLPPSNYGLSCLTVRRSERKTKVNTKVNVIENEYYIVCLDEKTDGFMVTDKETGLVHHSVCRLVDKGDAGDEYTYSWPEQDTVCILNSKNVQKKIEIVDKVFQRITLTGSFSLPESISSDRKTRSETYIDNLIQIQVSLYPGIDIIDFHIEFDNHSKDHRLQVESPSGILTTKTLASSAFAITCHPVKQSVPKQWMEYPFSVYATHGFIDAGDESAGICIAADGLTEYEAENRDGETYLRLTLLRCVGWLSRADLLTRHGNGGWSLPTPGAQCLGVHNFHFAVSYRSGTENISSNYAKVERMLHPSYLCPFPVEGRPASIMNPVTFLSQLPSDVRLSALKPAEDGNGVILRVFSIDKILIKVNIDMPEMVQDVWNSSLDEQTPGPAEFKNGTLSFTIKPGEIRSFRLIL